MVSEMKYQRNIYVLSIIVLLYLVLVYSSGDAQTGPCVNCHTMHNSQNGTAMATYGADGKPWKGTGPYGALVRGDCLGCHGIGTSKIVTIGGSDIPQVYHTDATDLAGGNFAYITGAKSRVTADQNTAGHNVKDVGINDSNLNTPPGLLPEGGHDEIINDTNLTCAGYIGCHGKRNMEDSNATGIPKLKGAHHNNVDGKCETADTVANSYRFLLGVKGLENTGTYKWQNYNATNHNEYFGAITPDAASCSNNCHPTGTAQPPNHTISGFCATCHGQFHDVTEIGGTSSPFTRHPTDIVFLPASGEYTAYTTYSIEAPVARQTVFDSISSTVQPGTDVVMCLSCHAAHATPYADILKWDYSTMIAGGGGSGGCFTCHTQKKNP